MAGEWQDPDKVGQLLLGVAAVLGAIDIRRRGLKTHKAVEQINSAVNHVGPEGVTLTNRVDEVVTTAQQTFQAIGRVEGKFDAHAASDERMFTDIRDLLRAKT